jgi:hypothetical protein
MEEAMVDVVETAAVTMRGGPGSRRQGMAVDGQRELIDQLVQRAWATGRQLTGDGGLLAQLTSGCWSRRSRVRSAITWGR